MKRRINTKILASKRYYIRLLVLVLLISLLPLSMISIFAFKSNANMLERQIFDTSNNYLIHTVNAVETIIVQLENSLKHFSTSPELISYQHFPNGSYYENLSGSLTHVEKPILYDYLFKKKDVVRHIEFIKNLNPCFHSAYFVDYIKGIAISSGGIEMPLSEFKKTDLGKYYKGVLENNITISNHVFYADETNISGKRIMPLLFALNYGNNRLIINVDLDLLYHDVIDRLDLKYDNQLIVNIENKDYLYDSNSELAKAFVNNISTETLSEGGKINRILELNDNRILLTYHRSNILNWDFYSIIQLDKLYSFVGNNNKLIFAFNLIVLVLTLALSIMEARRFYKPVNNLVKLVEGKVEGIDEFKNEFNVIENVLKKSFVENEIMQERIEESLMASRERFIKLFIHDQFIKKEILEGLEYFDIDLIPNDIVILLISANYDSSDNNEIEDKEFVRLSIIEIVTNMISERFKCITVEIMEGFFVSLFNCNQEELSGVYSIATHIQQIISTDFNIECSIGIGNFCSDISTVPKAYDDLFQAMRRRKLSDTYKVFYSKDIRSSNENILIYSREDEKILNQYIVNRDKQNVINMLNVIFEKIECQKDSTSFRNVQYITMQLLSSFILLASEMGIDLEQSVKCKRNLYAELLRKNSILEIKKWLEYLVDVIIKNIPEERSTISNEYVIQVINILNNNYLSEITLTSVAEGLGLNPSYLSRIFKESTGKSFIEYLTEIRIEKSKELLSDPDLKVSTLSNLMGYSNSNYFIKIFRKYTGVTPGEFRKILQENA